MLSNVYYGGGNITAREFRKKTRADLASPYAERIKVGRYYVTRHAQNRMALRDIYTGEVVENLCRKPVVRTPTKVDDKGRPGYQRYSSSIMTVINPTEKTVASVRPYHDDEAKKMGIRNHRKYVKQSDMDRAKVKTKKTTSSTKKRSMSRSSTKATTSSCRPSATPVRRSSAGTRRVTKGSRR